MLESLYADARETVSCNGRTMHAHARSDDPYIRRAGRRTGLQQLLNHYHQDNKRKHIDYHLLRLYARCLLFGHSSGERFFKVLKFLAD